MAFVPASNGVSVNYHQNAGISAPQTFEAPATVDSVLNTAGTSVALHGDGFTIPTVAHISAVPDPNIAAAYWLYGDERDGDGYGGLGGGDIGGDPIGGGLGGFHL